MYLPIQEYGGVGRRGLCGVQTNQCMYTLHEYICTFFTNINICICLHRNMVVFDDVVYTARELMGVTLWSALVWVLFGQPGVYVCMSIDLDSLVCMCGCA